MLFSPILSDNRPLFAAMMLGYCGFIWGKHYHDFRALDTLHFFLGWVPAIVSIASAIGLIGFPSSNKGDGSKA